MKRNTVNNKKELEQKLREAFADMNKGERIVVLDSVLNHLIALDIVQQMDYRLRMVFWKCNYHVYDFLRKAGLMGRESGPLSKDVREFLSNLFAKLVEKDDDQQEGHDAN
jgi:hypothetical protein